MAELDRDKVRKDFAEAVTAGEAALHDWLIEPEHGHGDAFRVTGAEWHGKAEAWECHQP